MYLVSSHEFFEPSRISYFVLFYFNERNICVCVWPIIAPRLNFGLDNTQPLPPSLHWYYVKFEPWCNIGPGTHTLYTNWHQNRPGTAHSHCNLTRKLYFHWHIEEVKWKSQWTKLFISYFKWSKTLLEPKLWVLHYRELLKKPKVFYIWGPITLVLEGSQTIRNMKEKS
jgi:hypothetical protein